MDSSFASIGDLEVQGVGNSVCSLSKLEFTLARILTPNFTFFIIPQSTSVFIVIVYLGFKTPNLT
jgi:hypothetical protein